MGGHVSNLVTKETPEGKRAASYWESIFSSLGRSTDAT